MSLFNPSRDEVRQFFCEAWRKYHAAESLTGMEGMALQVMQMHPEYHALLEAPECAIEQEYFPEMGVTNPFLHMSLHLSILEQLSIDQPPGIVTTYQSLRHQHGDEHPAQHALMECLAETIWRAQRDGAPPDTLAYLQCMKQRMTMHQ
jgi:hypothetical protein